MINMQLLPLIFIFFQQTDTENTQNLSGNVVVLISQQILVINLQGNVKQPERRTQNQILGWLTLTEIHFKQVLDSQPTMTLTISSMSISCIESISNRKSSGE